MNETTVGPRSVGLLVPLLVSGLLLAAGGSARALAAGRIGRAAPHTWSVDEHTRGVLVRDTRVPLVGVRVEFPVGAWSRWAVETDVATAMAAPVHDPDGELRRRSDRLAARLSTGAGDRVAWIEASCLAEDLPAVIELVHDVLANDRFDRAELKRWKRGEGIAWKASLKDVRFRARQLAARTLFVPGDPRRRPYERPRRVETRPATLRETRDRIARLPGRLVGLWGDLEPDEAEAVATKLRLPAADPAAAPAVEPFLRTPRPLDERENASIAIPRLTQVYFGLVRESLPMTDPDYPALLLANHVLGGHFYSRVSVALRHEEGDTYGAGVRLEADPAPVPLAVASFTRAANAEAAQGRMLEALAVFHRDGVTEAERREAVSYLRGREPFDRQEPRQVLVRRLAELRLGLPTGFLDELPNRAGELSRDELNRFIARFYDPAAFRLLRVVPE